MKISRQMRPSGHGRNGRVKARSIHHERPTRWYYAENAEGLFGIGKTAQEAARDLRHDYAYFHGGAAKCRCPFFGGNP